jgi:hypothetical protein
VFSALLFVIGYILREVGAFNFGNIDIFIASLVFIYAAPYVPPLFASFTLHDADGYRPIYELSNYFILSRILYYVPYYSPIHPGRVLTTFGAMSSVVEALNANGAANVANTSLSKRRQDTGKALLKSALILQLVILGLFVTLAAHFHRKCKKAGLLPKNLKAVLTTLYISSALIGTRTIYRTVEYFSTASLNFSNVDPDTITPVMRYEWFFWVFEAALMITNSFLLNARHPMRFLPRDNTIYLAEDGVTEVAGPGYLDSRKWYATFFDPFDVIGMAQGKNMNKKFWETHDTGRISNHDNSKDLSHIEMGVSKNGHVRG